MGLFKEFGNVSYQDWLDKITLDLKGKDFQQTLVWNALEGINVQPLYNSSSLANNSSLAKTPLKKYSGWKIRETITITSVEEANKKALIALKGGANSILFIGKIKDQQEMDVLLNKIDTTIIELHFYNSTPNHTLSLVHLQQGSITYDYLGELFISSKWNSNQKNDINELTTLTKVENSLKTIEVNGSNYSNLGATVIQEVAFTLNQAVEYLHLLTDKGIAATILASKIQFTFGIGSNYFFEIAKIRAARMLWKLILTQYQVEDAEYMSIHSITSSNNLTNTETHLNILRTTTEAMSAIMGGCDSLSVLPYDKSINFSERIARNIQHILKEEAFLDKVKNPADGSYYIEQLTDEIAKNAWTLFQEVEKKGGFLSCLESNFIKDEINTINPLKSVNTI